jgi:choline dehydrogenase-like flavoprotein
MELDARTLGVPGLDADVCIVGAGPAGLTLAGALARAGWRVVLLESGGHDTDAGAQALNEGAARGDPYAGPGPTRHRGPGGTVALWNTYFDGVLGAKYTALSPVDLEARDWWPLSGWPLEWRELAHYYARAEAACELVPETYGGEAWVTDERAALALEPGSLVTDVYRIGSAEAFLTTALHSLRRASNVVLCLHATMTGIALDARRRTVTGVTGQTLAGKRLSVRARYVVLAGGAIENARLLLLISRAHDVDDPSGLLGRCFMEHPRDLACRLLPAEASLFDRCGFYDVHRGPAGILVGHLTVSDEARRREGLPAMSVTLQPVPRGLAWSAAERLRARLLGPRESVRAGWWTGVGTGRRYSAFALLINLEQGPDPDNRITLSDTRDAFGLPRATVHWRWTARDRTNLARLRALLAAELKRHGLGRVVCNADVAIDADAHHHLGTTRMDRDARNGVVDEHGRLHALSNMYVAGSSVFPTGGFANPTLTIAALALRLADHLAMRLAADA